MVEIAYGRSRQEFTRIEWSVSLPSCCRRESLTTANLVIKDCDTPTMRYRDLRDCLKTQ